MVERAQVTDSSIDYRVNESEKMTVSFYEKTTVSFYLHPVNDTYVEKRTHAD